MKGILNKVLKVGVVKLLSIPLSLLVSIVLARQLGPDLFGQYAYIIAIIPILTLPVTGGLPQLLVRSIASYAHSNNKEKMKGIIIFSYFWAFAFSLIVITTVFFFARYFVEYERLSSLKLAVWLVPIFSFIAITAGIIKGFNRPVVVDIIQQALQPALILLCLCFTGFYSVLVINNVFYIQIIVGCLCVFIFTYSLMTIIKKQNLSVTAFYQIKVWLKSLLPFSLIVLANTFNTQIGILVLGIYSPSEAIAGLRIAERGVQFVAMSLAIINSVTAPYIVRLYKDNNIQDLQVLAKNIARGALAIALPIVIIFIVFGKYIIETIFGIEYVILSYLPLVILSIGQLFNMYCGAVGNLLSMSGNAALTLKGQIIALMISISACFLLVPLYGAIGAAVAVSLGLISWNIILLRAVKKVLNINASAI